MSWIIVAWTDDEGSARACTWLKRGTPADASKAEAFISREYPGRGRVYCYPRTERRPLERARKEILLTK